MCNFVPGRCIAVGPANKLYEVEWGDDLPGRLEVVPLLPGDVDRNDVPEGLRTTSIAVITQIPAGAEVMAATQLAARLAESVRTGDTVVELDYRLPRTSREVRSGVRLAEWSRRWCAAARKAAEHIDRSHQPENPPVATYGASPSAAPRSAFPPVAILDSGVAVAKLNTRRSISVFDYGGGLPGLPVPADQATDPIGHGTRVAKVLCEALREEVPIAVGCLGDGAALTVFNVIRAMAHLVAVARPRVLNLSLAPMDDAYVCEHCQTVCRIYGFLSQALPHVMKLFERDCAVTMSVGNVESEHNGRFVQGGAENLFLVEALNSRGELASYSSRLVEQESSLQSLAFFGGDPPDMPEAREFFLGDPHTYGTSFAAPLAAAALYPLALRHPRNSGERLEWLRRYFTASSDQWLPDWMPAGRPFAMDRRGRIIVY